MINIRKRQSLEYQRGYEDAKKIYERKKGAWIPQNYSKTNGTAFPAVYYYPKCSVCEQYGNYTNFCPNCGADMMSERRK